MKKGVFSMYATKQKQPAFYISEYSYPSHKNTELEAIISSAIVDDVSNSMKHCIWGIACQIVSRSRKSNKKVIRGGVYRG